MKIWCCRERSVRCFWSRSLRTDPDRLAFQRCRFMEGFFTNRPRANANYSHQAAFFSKHRLLGVALNCGCWQMTSCRKTHWRFGLRLQIQNHEMSTRWFYPQATVQICTLIYSQMWGKILTWVCEGQRSFTVWRLETHLRLISVPEGVILSFETLSILLWACDDTLISRDEMRHDIGLTRRHFCISQNLGPSLTSRCVLK